MTSLNHESALKLLDITLKPSGAIVQSAIGDFTTEQSLQNEIAVLRTGGTMELYRITVEEDDGVDPTVSLKLVTRMETRSILRCMTVVRLSGGGKRDVLAVGSDSGCVTVIDFEGGVGTVLHNSEFGKVGCRRSTEGQYIASDPRGGRAILISAVEKRKLVYVLNRDSSGKPTIASPLEAHRSRTIVLDVVGLDNGYDNPIFGVLEMQYPDMDGLEDSGGAATVEREIAYYELDLGLNHVVRRWAKNVVVPKSNVLAALPGGGDGPGGVLVCGENFVEYLHETITTSNPNNSTQQQQQRMVCAIPRREIETTRADGGSPKPTLIQNITIHKQKKRGKFFALLQTELGDVYKLSFLLSSERDAVLSMTISYLDTLPVSKDLNVSKKGMLFASGEFGEHGLYQFERIDIEGVTATITSRQTIAASAAAADSSGKTLEDSEYEFYHDERSAIKLCLDIESQRESGDGNEENNDDGTKIPSAVFTPCNKLKNLRKVDALQSLSPAIGIMVGELAGGEVSPQIYTLCGRGPTSTLRILRHGAAVTELAVSDLPGTPGGIFTIAGQSTSDSTTPPHDKYIIVSFKDATLVLSVGTTVEEVKDGGGLVTNAPTLACSALGGEGTDGGIVQVHPGGVRHYHSGSAKQWHCPGLSRIHVASANTSQVLIAFTGGQIIYFELDPHSGNLTEVHNAELGVEVCSMDLGIVPAGRTRSAFAAVGCRDNTVKVLSLLSDSLLIQKSRTVLQSRPHSVCLQRSSEDIWLTVGMDDGSSIRVSIDPITGAAASGSNQRFLGARPVTALRATVDSQPTTVLLSSRPWISRHDATTGTVTTDPLSYAPLDHAAMFRGAFVQEGIVATAGSTLRILSVETRGNRGESFNQHCVGLRYTPRQMCLLELAGNAGGEPRRLLAVCESDHNDYNADGKQSLGFDPTGKQTAKKKKSEDDAMDMDEDDDADANSEESEEEEDEEVQSRATTVRGPVPLTPGTWGGCIRLLDPSGSGCTSLDVVELEKNEAALCCCSVRFHSRGESLLAVGTATGLIPRGAKKSQPVAHIILYRVILNGDRLQMLHRTKVEAPVLALAHFQGRLLAGVGGTLRLYEMGKKQLLRKCEYRSLPSVIKTLQTAGDRAYIGDMLHGMHFIRYDTVQDRFVSQANDKTSRCVTCQELIDLNTVAVGDKFGNISILRLPRASDSGGAPANPTNSATRALWESRQDTTPKLELICNYYVGEIVTGMTRAALVAGGAEALIYVTITGRINALLPFGSREDTEFYQQLELNLRMEAERVTGRDPCSYRSYYAPIRHIMDGDLCDAYALLSADQQAKIAEKLDRSVGEIMKKLEDTRNGLL